MSEHGHQKDHDLGGDQSTAPANDKVDPVTAGHTTRTTIAGRDVSTGGSGDISNTGEPALHPHRQSATGATQRGGPEGSSGGVTGTTGQPESSAHQGPENQAGQADEQG